MTIDVTWLGHSTAVIRLGGASLLTDPLLGRHAGLLRRRGPAPRSEQWSVPDAVLVSHLHHEPRRPGLARAAGYLRVRPADVCRARAPADAPRPNAAHGHLVVGPSARVWVVGDTSLYDDMAGLPRLAGGPIDLALVPVGGWGPRLSGGHKGPEDAARACALAGVRAAVPVHWGTLHPPGVARRPPGWMDRPGAAFVAALGERASGCRAHLLRPGESLELGGAGLPADDEGGAR